jgi:hypothetical protein
LADSITSNVTPKDGRYNLVLLASYNDFRAQAPRYFLIKNNQSNLLGLEEYPQSDTLFVIQDDPKRWSNPLMTDIWELNSYSPLWSNKLYLSKQRHHLQNFQTMIITKFRFKKIYFLIFIIWWLVLLCGLIVKTNY